jgi:hypothetical protein
MAPEKPVDAQRIDFERRRRQKNWAVLGVLVLLVVLFFAISTARVLKG